MRNTTVFLMLLEVKLIISFKKKKKSIRAVILVIHLFIGLKDYTPYVKESEITYRQKAWEKERCHTGEQMATWSTILFPLPLTSRQNTEFKHM